MEARILPKSEEAKWDKFLLDSPLATIHQTCAWGHFQEQVPARGKYWILVLEEKGKILGGSMIIRHRLPRGYSWLYAARGPLLNYSSKNINSKLAILIEALKGVIKEEKAVFLRIDPPLKKEDFPKLKLKGFSPVSYGFQPQHTLILDIDKNEEEILAQMKPKGRYNIKIAQKNGVEVIESHDAEAFHKILAETTSRDNFHGHDAAYYAAMLKNLGPKAKLYLAKYQDRVIAGLIATFYKDTAIYYFGASSNADRNVMAPYLLQWQAIRDAKAAGCKYYDFLGIAPENAKNHPWQGVTEFKKKFGGHEISYLPALELPLKKLLYALYKIHKK